ncbi:MAG: DUF1993 domain-containing protein [Paludibacterium sp.]|uniref:DUF1993 domain-containing protein n=1 Tax=Paludibacterium sp. TaxID=1917523 RepID=UPI0025D49847|nr:DUF1993 domain-containing protein [Paludibacterium sp.]MBV8048188.1 DUF1993 domain-containing protein [Paludibacterium sp.]MBV8645904.1 DUF1993 domain-containing protein [Paludibacterium sp.]
MSFSMYDASVPVFKHMLCSMSAILRKAAAHAEAKKIAPEALLNARLFPDMYPLTRQVQIATDQAKGCVSRLAGVEIPSYEDTETTFDELQARIAKTLAYLDGLSPAQFDGSESRDITLTVRGEPMTFKGAHYLLQWVFPNFYFHLTTAYDILRHNGVEVGKRDFLAGGV